MLPLIYTDPTATGLFMLTCLVWLVPEAVSMRRQMAKVSRGPDLVRDRGSLVILLVLQWTGLVLGFLFAWLLTSAAITRYRLFIFILGETSVLLGVSLRWWAIRVLGRYFTRDVAVANDQDVIQVGPYRFIRHPAYSGTFLTMVGLGLLMLNWVSLITLLLGVFLGHFYRVGVEEKALVQAVGRPYVEYMCHTKRFIPWIL